MAEEMGIWLMFCMPPATMRSAVPAMIAEWKSQAPTRGERGFSGDGKSELTGFLLRSGSPEATRALAAGFEYISALIEERIHETGPSWFHEAPIFQTIDNYLRSGIRFVYVQAALVPAPEPSPSSS